MGRFSKYIALIIAGILTISILSIVGNVSAQTISNPSVPEFTVNYVDHSYYVPITYTNYTNPYTGQQETREIGGYTIENKTIDVTIKNQPFNITIIDGNTTHLYYEIRWKGHFENWIDHYINGINWYSDKPNFYDNSQYGIEASNSDSTVISFSSISMSSIPNDGQVDFEVKTQIGYTYLQYGNHAHLLPIGASYQYITESDWSNIQTITMSDELVSPSPTVPEFPFQLIFLFAVIPLIAILVLRRKKTG